MSGLSSTPSDTTLHATKLVENFDVHAGVQAQSEAEEMDRKRAEVTAKAAARKKANAVKSLERESAEMTNEVLELTAAAEAKFLELGDEPAIHSFIHLHL